MNDGVARKAPIGEVVSLHLHPAVGGEPMQSVEAIELIAAQGVAGDSRYFERQSRMSNPPSKRQVSLIEREQIGEHAAALGLETISPGAVRSNIETSGIALVALVGKRVRVGEAVLDFVEPRKPCEKMDAVCLGLRALMEPDRQGVMARVVSGGRVRLGDKIELTDLPAE